MTENGKRALGFELFDTAVGPMGISWTAGDGRVRVKRIFLPGEKGLKTEQDRRGAGARVAGPERGPLKAGTLRAGRLETGALGAGAQATPPETAELVLRIQRYLEGEPVSLDTPLLDLGGCTAFQRSVLYLQCRVPRGMVSTYGGLAAAAGRPGGARAVGQALGSNPFPLVVPCHRTVRGDGTLGGFGGGLPLKERLLALEGVSVGAGGIICLGSFRFESF